MTDRPRLYPSHQHQWADADPQFFHAGLVRCTVCGFQAPRNVVEAFDTIRAEIADARADIAKIQAAQTTQIPVEHYPRCNPECDGDTHMLLPDDQPGQETRADA